MELATPSVDKKLGHMCILYILGIKTTLICPATEKHVAKYRHQESYLVAESGDDYKNITLPYIEKSSFNINVRLGLSRYIVIEIIILLFIDEALRKNYFFKIFWKFGSQVLQNF